MSEDKYRVKPVYGKKPVINVKVPGSKSITNRALLIAALAKGKTVLQAPLFSNDSLDMIRALKTLGIRIEENEKDEKIVIYGCGGELPEKEASLNVGSAGTAARFLTALLSFSGGFYKLDASEQMRKRPMKPLIEALRSIGVRITCHQSEGYFPFTVDGRGVTGGRLRLDTTVSSQFLSAVLMAGTLLKEGISVEITGRTALPYVEMTVQVMEAFGGKVVKSVSESGAVSLTVKPADSYTGRVYDIEPDISAACYFYGAAALLGTSAVVEGVRENSIQGDIKFLEVLKALGCSVNERKEGLKVIGPENGIYNGIEADLNSFSDQTMTLSALSVFAKTPVKITGISHIRYQETDRISAIKAEVERLGLRCEAGEGDLTVFPDENGKGRLKETEIETYNDHRMAMAFALVGLRREGIIIKNPGCAAKTFKNYFEILNEITTEA